ncbi:expressed unknown protein [Seminavis robusta]|uniref:Uncharacterized protein n=1 Tax=Seminavis robusta TaxID=568900 RepID=A0A9N8EAH2_9STRA|nr:expressed unknown protein [Seminavis robusta]|eukprot:Sro729_g193880.1 n/a (504) ;mRNA; r:37776-39287
MVVTAGESRLVGTISTSCATITTTTSVMAPSVCTDTIFKAISGKLELSVGCSAVAVLASLQRNPPIAACVTKVVIQGTSTTSCSSNLDDSSGSSCAREDLIHLLASVGSICPRLEELIILLDTTNTTRSSVEFPVAALTAFFQQAPKHLVSLKISAVIEGNQTDFVELEKSIGLYGPGSWKDLRLEFCEPSRDTHSLDPLLGAFAAAPSLKQVTLSGTSIDHSRSCTGPSLVKLVRSHLEVLTIWGGKRRLDTQDTCALIRALETHTSLKELTLHARGLNPTVGQALAKCLSVNSSIQRLILNVSDNSPTNSPRDYTLTTTLLADALCHDNRTLRMLSLDYSTDDQTTTAGDSLDHDFYEYDVIDETAKAVRDTQAVTNAFTKMLYCNPVLEVLWMNVDHVAEELDEEEEEASASLLTLEMDMLLRLNRFGIRKRLLGRTASSMEWMDALASQNDDLNALFYLVSRDPSLCCVDLDRKRPAPTNGGTPREHKKQKTAPFEALV